MTTNLTDSILTSIKLQLGIPAEHTEFDTQLIKHINSVFLTLFEIGAGPKAGFRIIDASSTWLEYCNNEMLGDTIAEYVFLKVKMLFDPSTSSAVGESIKEQIKELEFRINTAIELNIL